MLPCNCEVHGTTVSARRNRKLARRALGHWWLTGGRGRLGKGALRYWSRWRTSGSVVVEEVAHGPGLGGEARGRRHGVVQTGVGVGVVVTTVDMDVVSTARWCGGAEAGRGVEDGRRGRSKTPTRTKPSSVKRLALVQGARSWPRLSGFGQGSVALQSIGTLALWTRCRRRSTSWLRHHHVGVGASRCSARWQRGPGMEQRAAAAMAFIAQRSRVSIANGGWPRRPYPCPRVKHLQTGAGGALTSRLGTALPFSASSGGWVLGCAPLLARVGDRVGAALGLVGRTVEKAKRAEVGSELGQEMEVGGRLGRPRLDRKGGKRILAQGRRRKISYFTK